MKNSDIIKELREKNIELVEKLKHLSENLDVLVEKTRLKPRFMYKNENSREITEVGLECELNSLEGMIRVYEHELIMLNQKLAKDTGPNKILEAEKKLNEKIQKCEITQRLIKARKSKMRELSKKVEKSSKSKDKDDETIEVFL